MFGSAVYAGNFGVDGVRHVKSHSAAAGIQKSVVNAAELATKSDEELWQYLEAISHGLIRKPV
jgi:hypothetical protein